jgi:tellurite resistance protein
MQLEVQLSYDVKHQVAQTDGNYLPFEAQCLLQACQALTLTNCTFVP